MTQATQAEQNNTPTEVAVILAAGEGSRLQEGGFTPPKPLVPLLGVSLAERVMDAFLGAGIRRFVVVVGAAREVVAAHFLELAARRCAQLTLVEAERWALGNGASALAARAAVGDRNFLLSMVDHLFTREMVEVVVARPPQAGEAWLAVDKDKEGVFDVDDLTKVTLEGDRITGIGKDLKKWDAGDTGLFHCTPALFAALEKAQKKDKNGLSDGVKELIRTRAMGAIDITGHEWLDVDTAAALREAEARHHWNITASRPWLRAWLAPDPNA